MLESGVPQFWFLGERARVLRQEILKGGFPYKTSAYSPYDERLRANATLKDMVFVAQGHKDDDAVWNQRLELSVPINAPLQSSITDYAFSGRYGVSLKCEPDVVNKFGDVTDDCELVTQLNARCMGEFNSTKFVDRASNNCTLLQVGATTVAARRFDDLLGIPLSVHNMYMHMYEAQRNVEGGRDLPWCWDHTPPEFYGRRFAPAGFIVAELRNTDMLHNVTGMAGDFIRVSGNCTMWHNLGLDLVRPLKAKQGPASGQLDELLEAVWVKLTNATLDKEQLVNGGGWLTVDGLEKGIVEVLQQVYQAANRLASQDLSSADSTRSTTGAVLDSTVLLVAVFATAASYKDMLGLAVKAQCKLLSIPQAGGASPPIWALLLAKLLTSAVIGATLVLSPLLVLLSEQSARDGNPKGDESKVGWISVNTGMGTGPYTLVAAISVNTRANYDPTAYSIVVANLVLACVGAAWLAALVWQDDLKTAGVRARKLLSRCA